jgi:uncharacterized protein YndB with AHSA1/START domain
MDAAREGEPVAAKSRTTVERKAERELVVTRIINGPAHLVFKAWTTPELLMRWWAPKSVAMRMVSCEVDVRVGGKYRFEFAGEGWGLVAFFGHYTDVTPHTRLAWTNEEGEEEGAVSSVTFEEKGGKTLLTFHELYPTTKARDEAIEGSAAAMPEQLDQLEELLATVGT